MASDQSMRIADLLEGRLADVAGALKLPIAWPNVAFTPPGGRYARVFILPADVLGQDVAGQMRTYQGILQVNIVTPAGEGVTEGRSDVDIIAAAFHEGTALVDTDLTVYINGPPQIHPGIQDDIAYTIPVSMSYRADY